MRYFVALSLLTLCFVTTNYGLDSFGGLDLYEEIDEIIRIRSYMTALREKRIGHKKNLCAEVNKYYQLNLNEQKDDRLKFVPEYFDRILKTSPHRQYLLHCGRILLPLNISVADFSHTRPVSSVCTSLISHHELRPKHKKWNSWKLPIDLMQTPLVASIEALNEGHVAMFVNCGPFIALERKIIS